MTTTESTDPRELAKRIRRGTPLPDRTPPGPEIDLTSPYVAPFVDRDRRSIVGYPTRLGPRHGPTRERRWVREIPSSPDRRGVGLVLGQLAAVGVTPPAGTTEAFAEALELQHRSVHEPAQVSAGITDEVSADARADIAYLLARREITEESARQQLARLGAGTQAAAQKAVRDALVAEAVAAYRRALDAIVADGDRLLADLDALARDAVDQQAQSARLVPELQDRWDAAHAAAATLRQLGALDDLVVATAAEWRYGRPDLVHLHRIDHASDVTITGRRDHVIGGAGWVVALHDFPYSHPAQGQLGAQRPSSLLSAEQGAGLRRRAQQNRNAALPDLLTTAAHPEWMPGCRAAADVFASVRTICEAQHAW